MKADAIYVTTTITKSHPYEQWLIALDPTDGSERWRVQIWDGNGNCVNSPSAGEETVFAVQIMGD